MQSVPALLQQSPNWIQMERCPEKMIQPQQETDTYTGDGPEIKSITRNTADLIQLFKAVWNYRGGLCTILPFLSQHTKLHEKAPNHSRQEKHSWLKRSYRAGKLTGIHLPVNALVWKMMILPSVSSVSTERASGITKAGQWTGNLSRRQRTVFLREPQQQEKNVQHQNTRERKAGVTCYKFKCLKLLRVLS